MARIIGEIRPQYAFVENSPMLIRRGLAVVISDLAEMGYACKWGIVGAHHAGGPHKRDRIWILANASDQGLQRREQQAIFGSGRGQEGRTVTQRSCSWWDIDPAELSDTQRDGLQRSKSTGRKTASLRRRPSKQDKKVPNDRAETKRPTKPGLGRMADELADRLEFFRTAFGGEIPRVGTAIPNRCARLKAIGNGQVPMAHNLAFKMLS